MIYWLLGLLLVPLLLLVGSTSLTAFLCGRYAIKQGANKEVVSTWFWKGFGLYLLEMPVNLLGLVIVALAIPFKTEDKTTEKPFTQYPQHGNWLLCRLPVWARPWDNPRDGLYGDKRGWWANERDGDYKSFLSCWLWTAVRNPANYFSRVMTAIDTTGASLKRLAGTSDQANENELGWHFISCEKDGEILGCLFQAAIKYPFSSKYGFYCRFGYKIELDEPMTEADDYYDRMRSSVWKFSPWKDLS